MAELFNWLWTFPASPLVGPAHGDRKVMKGQLCKRRLRPTNHSQVVQRSDGYILIGFPRQPTAHTPVLHACLILHASSGFKNLCREAGALSADAAMDFERG